jgi:hypothetical protein
MQSSSERPIITLLSDYGSLYPAQMKGAILSRTRDAVLVDIAYDVPPQDVRAGAFALMAAGAVSAVAEGIAAAASAIDSGAALEKLEQLVAMTQNQ